MKFFILYVVLGCSCSVLGLNSKFCSKEEDCKVEFSTCKNGLCTCDVGKVFSSAGDKCLDIAPSIGSSCQDNTQCIDLISGPSICDEKDMCRCAEGHMFLNNECVKYRSFGESCTDDTPCFDGVDLFALKCNNIKCVCNDGYYLRGKSGCWPSAKGNTECFFDIDCEDENQYCNYTLNSWGPVGQCIDVPNIECSTDEDCNKELENSYCSVSRHNKCTCKETFVYDKENHKCIPIGLSAKYNILQIEDKALNTNARSNIDVACTKDEECKNTLNSFCPLFRQRCTCKDGFIYDKNSGNCVQALGSACEATEPKCAIKHTTCNKDNLCQCPKYFIYSPYGEKCFKPTREFNLHSCGSNENCYSFGPHAICSKANANATTFTCNCRSGSKFDENLKYCVALETGACKNNCMDKPHSKCVTGECICDEHYTEENLKCLPDLGYTCSVSANDCTIDNADCLPDLKICQCKKGFFKHGNRECLKIIENSEDTCEFDIQCIRFLDEGGACVNNTCACKQTHISNEEGKCDLRRSFGDQCLTKSHCFTMFHKDHVTCRNSACVCEYDYHYDEDKLQCVSDDGTIVQGQHYIIFLLTVFVNTALFIY